LPGHPKRGTLQRRADLSCPEAVYCAIQAKCILCVGVENAVVLLAEHPSRRTFVREANEKL